MNFRFVSADDCPALLAIYSQYIDTSVTFEYRLPTEAEFTSRIRNISGEYPYLVCEESGRIIGYAYAHRQAERAAYQWNAELSVYLDRAYTGRGLGERLYGVLMDLLRLQGVRTVYALVTSPNVPSEKLHRRLGFHCMGIQRRAGYKSGAWRDVTWFEKDIAPHDPEPAPFLPFCQVPGTQAIAVLQGKDFVT